MIRSALLLCAALLAAVTFACAPPPPPSTPGLVTPPLAWVGRGHLLSQCTAPVFASAVRVLSAGYDPTKYTPPAANMTTPLGPDTQPWKDLVAAFNAAPPWFQDKLCATTIYIDSTACPPGTAPCFAAYSWAYRDPNDPSKYYIALSQRLWDGGSAPIFSDYETALLKQVMRSLGMPWASASIRPPEFTHATNGDIDIDVPGLGVLGALAHEYGHILWYYLLKAPFDDAYDANTFCRTDQSVKKDGFFDKNWKVPVHRPPQWLNFADMPYHDQHTYGMIQISHLYKDIHNDGRYDKAAKRLNYLYSSDNNNRDGVWASLFGAVSPEEDFVETVKLLVMTDVKTNGGAPVTSMPLNIYATDNSNVPDFQPDLYNDFVTQSKKELRRKIDCITDVYTQRYLLLR